MATIEIDESRLAKIRKEAQEEFYAAYKKGLMDEIALLFRKRITMQNGVEYQSEGTMRAMIRDHVETFYLDEKTQTRAANYIDAVFQPVLDECIKDAARHAIRRTNFNDIVQHTKDKLTN